jgi:AGZA family xanthine/uracil permease-like MFS transporter
MAIPMTFSISTGIGFGLISLAAITVGTAAKPAGEQLSATGEAEYVHPEHKMTKLRESGVTPFTYGLAVVFLLHFLGKALLLR